MAGYLLVNNFQAGFSVRKKIKLFLSLTSLDAKAFNDANLIFSRFIFQGFRKMLKIKDNLNGQDSAVMWRVA